MSHNLFTRREFIKQLTGAAGAAVILPQEWVSLSPYNISITRERIPVQNLPREFSDFRIGIISDLHLGPWVSSDLIRESVRILEQEKPDLIVLGGDYIGIPESTPGKYLPFNADKEFDDIRKEELPSVIGSRLCDLLAPLAKMTKGRIASVIGNHDQWLAPKETIKALNKMGSRLLLNESFSIRRGSATILVGGVEDYLTGFPYYPFVGLAPKTPTILVSHNPDYVANLLAKGDKECSLFICGHTHGGQVKFPGLGALSYNVENSQFGEGLVKTAKGHVFTSRGVGVVELPFRLNCPPEVAILTLSRSA